MSTDADDLFRTAIGVAGRDRLAAATAMIACLAGLVAPAVARSTTPVQAATHVAEAPRSDGTGIVAPPGAVAGSPLIGATGGLLTSGITGLLLGAVLLAIGPRAPWARLYRGALAADTPGHARGAQAAPRDGSGAP